MNKILFSLVLVALSFSAIQEASAVRTLTKEQREERKGSQQKITTEDLAKMAVQRKREEDACKVALNELFASRKQVKETRKDISPSVKRRLQFVTDSGEEI